MKKLAFAAMAVVAAGSTAAGAISAAEALRLANAANVVQAIRPTIPDDLWARTRCAAVIPDVKKAAFIVGGEYGKGVMSCRNGEAWGAPVFMQLAKGSWGFQAGAEQVDLVLLVMNESGVQKLLRNKVNLGADASVAAGPMGRRGGVSTDAVVTAEILSYSRSKGLFAGIDLSGGILRPDEDANVDVYGKGSMPSAILATPQASAPPEAASFLSALRETGTAAPKPDAPAAASTRGGSSDEDIRGRVIDLQQSVDRMLADTTPAAVGTSGTVSSGDAGGATSVDRTRLLQLRAQIDALLAATSRR